MPDIMTVQQASELWHISPQRITLLCREGRIKGAYKIAASWVMPADTQKPQDARVTSGKWIGYKRPNKQNGGQGHD